MNDLPNRILSTIDKAANHDNLVMRFADAFLDKLAPKATVSATACGLLCSESYSYSVCETDYGCASRRSRREYHTCGCPVPSPNYPYFEVFYDTHYHGHVCC